MPTYEYKCDNCGFRFQRHQAITEAPINECPECRGKVHRLISGGAGYMLKGQDRGSAVHGRGACSFEESGKTCCGRTQRCDRPDCGE